MKCSFIPGPANQQSSFWSFIPGTANQEFPFEISLFLFISLKKAVVYRQSASYPFDELLAIPGRWYAEAGINSHIGVRAAQNNGPLPSASFRSEGETPSE